MKKFLSLVLALVMTMSLVTVSAGAKDFTDSDAISSEKYAEAIDVMSELEIIDGYNGGAFQPQGTLTRGAAAKIIACMMLGKTTAEALGTQAAPFKDVPVGSTFAGYIAYCAESGLIDGYADGTFRPSAQLTGFAFLKMLLTAMGYDSSVEGFTGPNWTVNVARRAIENGLTDGNDDFVGTRLATREEACLYAVNTIQATLVEYENKGTTITINGMEIVQGASAPKVVTSGVASQATSINSDVYTGTVSGASGTAYYTVEFGEKYMPKLSLKGTDDDFMRPAHIWSYDGKEIGTYVDDADLTYTAEVTANTIYDELGLTATVDAITWEDGVQVRDENNAIVGDTVIDGTHYSTFEVKNNATDAAHKIGGNGVLVQVFKSGHWQTGAGGASTGVWVTDVTITLVNTYVGDVVAKAAATSVKPAYITISARGDQGYLAGNFDTEDFEIDDVVLYGYSKKLDGGSAIGVKDVVLAETTSGNLTSYTTGESATVGGTVYDYSEKVANEAANAAINTDVTVVFDRYGYAIDIDGANDENYAVVLDYHKGLHHEATLLFADGSVEDVVLSEAYAGGTIGVSTTYYGDIVSYTIKNNDRYALDEKADAGSGAVDIENGEYAFTVAGTTRYANGDTVFLVKTVDANGNNMYAAYEGIKNVPDILDGGSPVVTVYSVNLDSSRPAEVVYVDATNAQVTSPSSDVYFLKGNNDGVSYTTGIGNYYRYVAVVNGELREGTDRIMAADDYVKSVPGGTTATVAASYGLFDQVSYDANNVVTLRVSPDVVQGTGVYRQSNDVLGTMLSGGSFRYYSVADNCFMVLVNEDGDITTGLTAASAVRDSNDVVWFKLNSSNEIASVYVAKVAGGEVEAITYDVAADANNEVMFSLSNATGTWTSSLQDVNAGTTVYVQANAKDVVVDAAGLTLIQDVAPNATTQGVWHFTMPAQNLGDNVFSARAKSNNTDLTVVSAVVNAVDTTSTASAAASVMNGKLHIVVTEDAKIADGDTVTVTVKAADANASVNTATITATRASGTWSITAPGGASVTVTAEDGVATQAYALTVGTVALSSDATLASAQTATAVGSPTGNGTANVVVDNGANTVTVTIDGGATAFAAGDQFTMTPAKNDSNATVTAPAGAILFTATSASNFVADTDEITVTAQDGTTKTYSVVVVFVPYTAP